MGFGVAAEGPLNGCRSKCSVYVRCMVDSGFSSSFNCRHVGKVSNDGRNPPLSSQLRPAGGATDLICDRIKHLLTSTFFVLRRMTGVCGAVGTGLSATWLTEVRGLEPALAWLLGLKVAAKGLGRNSWLLGFNLAPI